MAFIWGLSHDLIFWLSCGAQGIILVAGLLGREAGSRELEGVQRERGEGDGGQREGESKG